ncbi:hypothetical protein MKX01_029314 [Papaver californicum]|nr:hypothetical protein MKX01_029314 [Papaver californicum]
MARFNITTSVAILLVTISAIAARCQRQMRGMLMNMCRQNLRQSSQRGDDIIMMESNPTGEMMQDCCRETRGVSEECRCEAIRQMVQQMQGQAYLGDMMQKARQLPSMCGMRPHYGDFRGRYVEY